MLLSPTFHRNVLKIEVSCLNLLARGQQMAVDRAERRIRALEAKERLRVVNGDTDGTRLVWCYGVIAFLTIGLGASILI